MEREIITTKDGSHTISIPALNVTYHSIHGALQESMHVFIRAGLQYLMDIFPGKPLQILEIGFGTGLNALLTLQEAGTSQTPVNYTSLELFPLEKEKASQLNYTDNNVSLQELFFQLHTADWETDVQITSFFTIHKKMISLLDFSSESIFHAIYFDAFAPGAQPELWTKEVFEMLYKATIQQGVLLTYCSKGDVRRAMTAAGWEVEKLQGPPGKREMVRAHKKCGLH